MRYPSPLSAGNRVAVTAPSSGVPDVLWARLQAGMHELQRRGFDVVLGDCLRGDTVTSAPAAERAAELTAMLCDPDIHAVVPPWGGELAIDLLERLDWTALEQADPTWLVGFSDLSTLMVPIAVRLDWATLHGSNLLDTPYAAPDGLRHWVDVAAATAPVTQVSPGRYRAHGWDDYETNPDVAELTLPDRGSWTVLGGEDADFSGRLIGGCLECLAPLAGTPYGEIPEFGRKHTADGVIVYLEAAGADAYAVSRTLHGLRLAGWFDHATGVLIGRTRGEDRPDLTQHAAVADALADLGAPVVLDVECGHVPPFLPLVNGALAHVVSTRDRHEVTQTLT